MSKYFTIKEGALMLEFEGDEAGLKAKFANDKENAKTAAMNNIAKYEQAKKEINEKDASSDLETAEATARIAHLDAQIAKQRAAIKAIDAMNIGDIDWFVLESTNIG